MVCLVLIGFCIDHRPGNFSSRPEKFPKKYYFGGGGGGSVHFSLFWIREQT